MALASSLTASDFIQANRQRTRSMRFMQSAFQKVHCILTPGTAITAPKMQENDLVYGFLDFKVQGQAMRFAHLANLTGLPALIVPVGYSKHGLPISLQVSGLKHEAFVKMEIILYLCCVDNFTWPCECRNRECGGIVSMGNGGIGSGDFPTHKKICECQGKSHENTGKYCGHRQKSASVGEKSMSILSLLQWRQVG
uniref:Amidase domain-containing protein n=1 Tax=Eptatretus burgeri TaxID=7764 RepID=A0A8C4Q6T8_EPTBU